MEDSNAKLYEWWELAKAQFRKKMSCTQEGWGRVYKVYVWAFKKSLLDLMYRSLNSLYPFNLVKKLEEVESNGALQDKHGKEPQNFKKGGQNHQNEKVEEWE